MMLEQQLLKQSEAEGMYYDGDNLGARSVRRGRGSDVANQQRYPNPDVGVSPKTLFLPSHTSPFHTL